MDIGLAHYLTVSAILLGWLLLDEALLVRHVLGMAMIGLGLGFIDGRLPRLLSLRLQHASRT